MISLRLVNKGACYSLLSLTRCLSAACYFLNALNKKVSEDLRCSKLRVMENNFSTSRSKSRESSYEKSSSALIFKLRNK